MKSSVYVKVRVGRREYVVSLSALLSAILAGSFATDNGPVFELDLEPAKAALNPI